MKFRIKELRGLGPQAMKKLIKNGVYYANDLLNLDLDIFSKQSKISKQDLELWKSYVLLMQVGQIGPACANLLCRPDIGIKTIEDLAKANPENLQTKLIESNKKYRMAKLLPSIFKIRKWVEDARNYTNQHIVLKKMPVSSNRT
jgi:nucleotidyltransferase/DNA polymerase involved in DNA repair